MEWRVRRLFGIGLPREAFLPRDIWAETWTQWGYKHAGRRQISVSCNQKSDFETSWLAGLYVSQPTVVPWAKGVCVPSGSVRAFAWCFCLLVQGWVGFPCGSAGKESACNVGDLDSIPGLGRSPGEGKGYTLQCSGLENSVVCIVHGHRVRHDWATFTFRAECAQGYAWHDLLRGDGLDFSLWSFGLQHWNFSFLVQL